MKTTKTQRPQRFFSDLCGLCVFVVLFFYGSIVKMPALGAEVPARLVTVSFPVVAPTGTTTFIELAETTVIGSVMLVLPNLTSVTVEMFAPLMVTIVPALPLGGVNELITGNLITMKLPVLIPVPDGLVTLIFD